ncbi:hypothetical protein [Azospirillum sp. ST 5-10]|uniref:hypothetical protein n=1 Tax=unclassified Azospirillum TaxID=2630922 RepID=UPI003F4A5675
MTTLAATIAAATAAPSVGIASQAHRELLEEFIGLVKSRMDETRDPFIEDSLKDLLVTLTEQHDGYFAAPDAPAAA